MVVEPERPAARPDRAACDRPAARRDLPAPVVIDPDQLLRRSGHDARAAAERRAAAARHAHADGPAHGDGNPALRAVLAARRRVAGPRAQAPGLCARRECAGPRCRQRAAGLVAGVADDAVALRCVVRDWHGLHGGGQRGADRAHASRRTRSAGRGACEERAGVVRRRGGWAGRGGRFDQGGGRAAGVVGGCALAHHLGRHLARHRHQRRATRACRCALLA